jgi:hypothetical protein
MLPALSSERVHRLDALRALVLDAIHRPAHAKRVSAPSLVEPRIGQAGSIACIRLIFITLASGWCSPLIVSLAVVSTFMAFLLAAIGRRSDCIGVK